MARSYSRIEFTPERGISDTSLWRNTTDFSKVEAPDPKTDYAWKDRYAYLDRVGYAPDDYSGRYSYDGYSGGSSGGSGGLYSMYGGGIDYLSQQQAALQDARAQAEAAQRSRVDAAVGDINAQQAGINRTADQSATQAYIARMKAERSMPQQQAALGLSGGASESAMLGLNTGYENSRNAIMRDRDAQIQANIDLQNKVRLEGDASLSDIQNAYAMKDLDLLQDQANRQAQYEQMVYQAKLAQQQWEQQQGANWDKYDRERKDYLSDVMSEREWKEAQTQAEREYQMMLARQKGSGSSGGMTDSQKASSYLAAYNATGDPKYLDAYNQALGLAGAYGAAPSGVSPSSTAYKFSALDQWNATLSPQEFQNKVYSAMANNNLSIADYEEWLRR